ncbi:conserved hypothetical protein [Hyella patelloides LEGE 07179]|uniref:Uncharacterized protein n=1 Tax=Hyella patelloides LEGE 07179 TaxID=945734 RepID=A0A563W1B8_9CYAN|nr:hypothetical protein [Hyella patelloides]VEP17427.1 conserved hypothetical protein [Hyella patelloides LEGE 07179]
MVKKKLKAKTFQGMNYRKVQRKNSRNRNLLIRENQKWLKNNGYRNIGWNNVISLYQAIAELQRKEQISEFNLEELFLEADRIGNKYFSQQEIHNKQQKIAQELNEITEIIDYQFPDNKIEIVDYS